MSKTRNSGFVLVLVLAVIAIAGTLLAAAARRSGQQALQTATALRNLQVKWAFLSSRAVYLPMAEKILHGSEEPLQEPVTTYRWETSLNGMVFHFVVSDEQAKANVNLLEERQGHIFVAPRISALQANVSYVLQVQLTPLKTPTGDIAVSPVRYCSYDQLFVYKRVSELLAFEPERCSPIDRVTCWGSGRLNFKRADRITLQIVTDGLLDDTQLQKLLEFRAAKPSGSLEDLFRYLEISEKNLSALRQVLTDTSTCFSLWSIVEAPSTKMHHLFIDTQGGADSDAQRRAFAWQE